MNKPDARSRLLGALNTHAWLPVVAWWAGMSDEEAKALLVELELEGKVRRHVVEANGRTFETGLWSRGR